MRRVFDSDSFDFPREDSPLEGIEQRRVVAGEREKATRELRGGLGVAKMCDGGRSGGKEEEGGGSEEEEEMSAGDLAAEEEGGGVDGAGEWVIGWLVDGWLIG